MQFGSLTVPANVRSLFIWTDARTDRRTDAEARKDTIVLCGKKNVWIDLSGQAASKT